MAAEDDRPPNMEHRLKYKPKRLPHWDFGDVAQTITYRLADSVSQSEYDKIQVEANNVLPEQRDRYVRTCVEKFIHENRYGSCCLNNPHAAKIVIDAWYFYAGDWYDLYEWVVMGNHVHVLIRQYEGHRLGDIVGSWKSYTSKKISFLLNLPQPIWREGYWDRMIRDEGHFEKAKQYILNNPQKSGYNNWPYISGGLASPPTTKLSGGLASPPTTKITLCQELKHEP